MAARGTEAKQYIIKRIFEYFPSAFMTDKELRIAATENGERVEIKVALTCAKDNIGEGTYDCEGTEDNEDTITDVPGVEKQASLVELVAKMGVVV